MAAPVLVIVSGPAGTGKTTLAHLLARRIGCPAICRDELKEGMARGVDAYEPAPGDDLTRRASMLFFETLRLLVERGVTVVGEAAFQHGAWRSNLAPLMSLADVRVVHCHTDPTTGWRRITERAGERRSHDDGALIAEHGTGERYFAQFQRVAFDVPSLDVDTTDGYRPGLDEITRWLGAG